MRISTTAAMALLIVGVILARLTAPGQLAIGLAQDRKSADTSPKAPADFKGTIKLDIRESKPDWGPFMPKTATPGGFRAFVLL